MESKYAELAETVAQEAHKGQKRWNGEPYITHPKALSEQFCHDSVKAVAWLHDVLEDNKQWTAERLYEYGFPRKIVDAVVALTRLEHQTYAQYLQQVAENVIAVRVKIEDLRHNLSDLQQPQRKDKYEVALLYLHLYLEGIGR